MVFCIYSVLIFSLQKWSQESNIISLFCINGNTHMHTYTHKVIAFLLCKLFLESKNKNLLGGSFECSIYSRDLTVIRNIDFIFKRHKRIYARSYLNDPKFYHWELLFGFIGALVKTLSTLRYFKHKPWNTWIERKQIALY